MCRCSISFLKNAIRRATERRPSWRHLSNGTSVDSSWRTFFHWNSAIALAFRNGDLDGARSLFEEMPERNQVTWNCMISGYGSNRNAAAAQKMFDLMPDGKNTVTWTALLTAYAKCGMLKEARRVFDSMPCRNIISWNAMITGYIDSGKMLEARELFDSMPVRNTASWAIVISGYLRLKLVREARFLFDRAPVLATSLYNAMISGYAELGQIKNAEDMFAKMPVRDVVSWNTMITCYAHTGRMDLAQELFDGMPYKDTISWTSILRGHLQNRSILLARQLFDDMPYRDTVAWNTMIAGYVQAFLLPQALSLFEKMPAADVVSWNSILHGFVLAEDMEVAKAWFERIPHPSETSWNTLISGYRDEKALILLSQMVRAGFKPDQGTFSVAISVSGSLAFLGWGKILHLGVILRGYSMDILVASSLTTMYSKCGLLEYALQIFHEMPKRDTVAWNAMIGAHAHHGQAWEALRCYAILLEEKIEPDWVTFLCLLTACVHRGLVKEAKQVIESMQKDWNLVPRSDHLGSFIDLLGRSGSVDEAHKLIELMPVDLRINSWETLLSSCHVHGVANVGSTAAKQVARAEPHDGGVLVLMSNFLAAEGLWQEAAQIRQSAKGCQVKKETGCSWIEIKGDVHGFVSWDRMHPLIDEIYRLLGSIAANVQR